MVTRHAHGAIQWIDILEPTAEELRDIAAEFSLSPKLTHELSTPAHTEAVISAQSAVRITLDYPVVKVDRRTHPHIVHFIIAKDVLITVRYSEMSALHQFAKEFEVVSALKKKGARLHGGHVFLAIANALYEGLAKKLTYIETYLEEIEDEMFHGKEKEMVTEISVLSRKINAFHQSLSEHTNAFQTIPDALAKLFTKRIVPSVDTLIEKRKRLNRKVLALQADAVELRETNNALLTTKQNEIMKNLTIMAFITFPLTLVSSLLGMNTQTLPLVGVPGDFYFILAGMAVVTISFFAFFKYKRWL